MRQGLWLSGAALLAFMVWFTGCASGNSTGNIGGTGTGTGGLTTTTGSGGSSGTLTGAGGTTASAGSTGSTTGTGGSGTASTSSGTAGTGGSGTGGAGTGGMDAGPPPGLGLGADCNQDSDCASNLCKPVVIDSGSVCVTPCASQSDCSTTNTNYFCEPITAGSSNGYCIPHSPAHCLSCTQDSDCGSLSEVCFQAPGDNAMACHIDCSLSGASACPSDYSCVAETVNGQGRMLCRPNGIADCLDAVGGYCDRLAVPQACTRTNTAGNCTGERTCMSGSNRFSDCDATAPQCKTDCTIQDPAHCTEIYCAGATDTVTNCGGCGKVCPGYMQTADNVTCNGSMACTFSCQGESYDVNNSPADGCEVADAPQGNHTKSSAASEGSVSDCDSGGIDFSFNGQLPSDKQAHANPAVVGFDATSGSAPDWYGIVGVGHTFCDNDLVAQLCVQGSSSPGCYKLTVMGTNTYSCQPDASGCCPKDPNPGGSCSGAVANAGICQNNGGQFDDNTTVYFEVQKTCTTSVIENVTYTVDGHF
jgi:hypothetical protein